MAFLLDRSVTNSCWYFFAEGTISYDGLGMKLIRLFIEASRMSGFESVQLGVIEENNEAFSFWTSHEFKEIRQNVIEGKVGKSIKVLVLEKKT